MYTFNVSTVNMNLTPRVGLAVMERNARIAIKIGRLAELKTAHNRVKAKIALDKQKGI